MPLSLHRLLSHFTGSSPFNVERGAEPGHMSAATRCLCGPGSGWLVPHSSAAKTFLPQWILGNQAVETSPQEPSGIDFSPLPLRIHQNHKRKEARTLLCPPHRRGAVPCYICTHWCNLERALPKGIPGLVKIICWFRNRRKIRPYS